jgi:hypothetical protein
VIAVGNEGGALEPTAGAKANVGGDLVAHETERSGASERPEMGERLRVDQADDALVQGNQCADQDREDDEESGKPLGSLASEYERDPEGHRRERVADVVDQVCEERDAVADDEDRQLCKRRGSENAEADADGAKTGA